MRGPRVGGSHRNHSVKHQTKQRDIRHYTFTIIQSPSHITFSPNQKCSESLLYHPLHNPFSKHHKSHFQSNIPNLFPLHFPSQNTKISSFFHPKSSFYSIPIIRLDRIDRSFQCSGCTAVRPAAPSPCCAGPDPQISRRELSALRLPDGRTLCGRLCGGVGADGHSFQNPTCSLRG